MIKRERWKGKREDEKEVFMKNIGKRKGMNTCLEGDVKRDGKVKPRER